MSTRKKRLIIDCHNHPDWYGHNLKKFLANMTEYRISQTWLLSWECPKDEYDPSYNNVIPALFEPGGPIPFSRCLAYLEQAPGKFVLGYAPDPRKPDAIDKMQAAIDIYGVKIYGELKLRMMYDNPDALRMFRFCGEKGLPVIVHLDYEFDTGVKYPRPNWWYGGGIEAFERAIQRCSRTIFLGHGPGFWAHISGDGQYDKTVYPAGKVVPGGKVIAMLRQYPNLSGDLSAGSGLNALKRDPAFAQKFLREFPDHILYSRDCFDNEHQKFLDGLGLSEAVLDKIYSGNALRLLAPKKERR